MWRLTERLHTCEMRSACERHTICFYTMFATHMSTSDKQYPIAKMSDAPEKPQANVHCPHQWPFAFLTNLAKEATRHETKNLVPTNDQAGQLGGRGGNTQMIGGTIGRPCQQMIRRCQQMIRRHRQENTQMIRNISSRWDHLWNMRRRRIWCQQMIRRRTNGRLWQGLTFWEHRCRRRSDALKIAELWRRWWVHARFIWPDHISTFHRSRPSLLDFLYFNLRLQFHRWPGFDRHTNVNQLY